MDDEEDGEPDGGEHGERKGGSVTVDDDGRVPLAVGIGKVWIDVAVDGRTWQKLVKRKLSRDFETYAQSCLAHCHS